MKIISLAWGEKFDGMADRLRANAAGFGISAFVMEPFGEPPSPQAAWAMKPDLLLETLGLYPPEQLHAAKWDQERKPTAYYYRREPIVWLDVDCVIRAVPWLLDVESSDADFYAIPAQKAGEWEPGILVALHTERAIAVLLLWQKLMRETAGWKTDGPLFSFAARSAAARVYPLPQEYYWHPSKRDFHGARPVTIESNVPLGKE